MASRRQLESSKTAQPGVILLVVHEFIARSADELSLAKGDRIELIEKDDDFGDGWYLGRHITNGNTGLFPEVYTTPAPKGTLANTAKSSATVATSSPANKLAAQQATKLAAAPAVNGDASPPDTQKNATATAARPGPTNAPQGGLRGPSNTNAVMNETLSVIDEHITDLNKPNVQSVVSLRRGSGHSGSEYSVATTQAPPSRHSYIHGEETDQEEDEAKELTEKDVQKWSPKKVAKYLETIGIESGHCKVFLEQEFSGDVLLEMDQSSIFLKELDLGPVGRRLKTWQKIRAFQDSIKANGTPTGQRQLSAGLQGLSAESSHHSSTINLSRSPGQSVTGDAAIRASPAAEGPALSPGFGQSRPSAASIRNLGQTSSRRHSSIEQSSSVPIAGHKQHGSFDRSWTLTGAAGPTRKNRMPSPGPSLTRHVQSLSSDQTGLGGRPGDSPVVGTDDLERDYMSAGEVDAPRQRKLIRKRDPQYRASSYGSESRPSLYSQKSGFSQKSTDLSKRKEISSPIAGSAKHIASGSRDESRVVGEPVVEQSSAAVTKLDYSPSSTRTGVGSQSQGSAEQLDSFYRKGIRAISDSVTGRDKQLVRMPVEKLSVTPQSPARTDASTPSVTSTSMEFDDIAKAKIAAANTFPSLNSVRRKQKKQTSAYTRGLEKKSPAEQIPGCEYSGWMKKKSSNLMTTWKPRLFVLRGRRLSYYYTETDPEEKGLIDISGHRVLPANNERITGLHAALTGAAASPTSLQAFGSSSASPITEVQSPSTAATSSATSPTIGTTPITPSKEQGFIFKLVPPRVGMNKAVNFTKPTVHYFWVPNIQEGRLWMAALMKATIDRDESKEVITTYQQKTISLAKARARKERPPALREDDELTTGMDDISETTTAKEADTPQSEGLPSALVKTLDGTAADGNNTSNERGDPIDKLPQHEDIEEQFEPHDQIVEVTNLETTPESTVLDKFSSGSRKSNRESSFKKLSLTARSFRSHSSSRHSSGAGKGLGIGGLEDKSGGVDGEASANDV